MDSNKKPYHFYCELFGENFYFFKGFSLKEFKEYMKDAMGIDVFIDKSFMGKFVHARSKDHEAYCIWVDSKEALAHECIHASMRLLYEKGVTVDHENDEILAYYVQMLMRKYGQL